MIPFKHLQVPVTRERLSKLDYKVLVGKKATAKITMCFSGHVSYAGRVTLYHVSFDLKLREALQQWLRIPYDAQNLQQFVGKSMNHKCKTVQKEIIYTAVNAMINELWQARNRSIFKNSSLMEDKLFIALKRV